LELPHHRASPPRRYVCCGSTPRAALSLLPTPPTTSRFRCLCRVERTWLARPSWLGGCVWVGGSWCLVGLEGESLCSTLPHSRPYYTPRLARGHRHHALLTFNGQQGFGATKAMRASVGRGVPIHIAHTTRYGRQREEALTRRLSCHCCVVVKVGHHVRHVAKYRVVTCRGWASTGPPSPRCGCRRPLNRAQSSVANYNAQLVCWLRVCS
jgi:hypothetical protein